jgi:allophanate hydrolase
LDGERVKGFLCEAHAVVDALDITEYRGFRAFVADQAARIEGAAS